MTTLAMTDPVLKRLFERLDFAPQPKDESLSHLLKYWKEKGIGRIAPSPQDMKVHDLKESAANAFILQFGPHGSPPALMFAGAALEALIGPCEPGAMLMAEAPQRRGIVRLRRLAELVRQKAEPVLAEFDMHTGEGLRMRAEIFLAPLSKDGHSVDGLFGGLSHRIQKSSQAPSFHAPHIQLQTHAPFLFALKSAQEIGSLIAHHANLPLQDHEERDFEDGEHKTRPLVDVRGQDVHVIAGLHSDAGQSVNDRLCRLLFFIGALKDAGAWRVNVIAPYLCYARKDRRTKPHDPVTTRYVGQLFEAVGTDSLTTMEVHNLAAFENAFRCNAIHLTAYATLARHVSAAVETMPVSVVSPDIGGAKRAELFRDVLEEHLGRPVHKAFADKQRNMGQVSGDLFAGNVSGCIAVILDDLISTGTTVARVAQQCRNQGASRIIVAATHGVGGAAALANLTQPVIDEVVLTNTIPQPADFVSALGGRLTILDVSDVFAKSLPL